MTGRAAPMPRCPTCGADIPAEAPGGWCPSCLFRGALDPGRHVSETPAKGQRRLTTDEADLRAGSSVPTVTTRLGDYELLDAVAHGAMGVVHRARQVRLDRLVALKLLLGGQYASQEARRRFRDEALAAARLSHPGIVPVYDVGEHHGQLYYSMELILDAAGLPAPTLADCVALGPLTPTKAVAYLQGVTAAVAHAHQHGILHRDLKPSNVLLAADDRPRVTDFGLARTLDTGADSHRTMSGQVLGTPGYLSPEQVSNRFGPVTVRSDVYALGALFYCLLAGRPPLEGGSTLEDLQRATETDPPPLRQINPQVPRDHEVVCLACLAKEPACRYPDAVALLRDLERLQRGEPPERRPVSRLTRLWYRARRKPAVASLGAALACVVVLGAPLIQVLRNHGHTQAQRAELERTTGVLRAANTEIDASHLREALHLLATGIREAPRQRALADRFVQLIDDHAFLVPVPSQSTPIHEWAGQELTPGLARSADGQWIAEITNRVDLLLRTTTRANVNHLLAGAHTKAIRSISFGHERTRLVSASADGTARIWDLRPLFLSTNNESRIAYELGASEPRIPRPLRTLAHPDRVLHAVFHPDGSAVATACADGQVRLWSLDRPEAPPRILFSHPNAVSCVRFNLDGTLLAIGTDDGFVGLRDAADGRAVCVPRRFATTDPSAHPAPVVDVECLSDPPGLRALVTGIGACAFRLTRPGALGDPDRVGSEAIVGRSGKQIPESVLGRLRLSEISASVGSDDGKRLAVAIRTEVRLYDAVTRKPTARPLAHMRPVRFLAFSPDGLRLATATATAAGTTAHEVRVWDVETGQPVTAAWDAGGPIHRIRFDQTRRLVLTDDNGPFWAVARCPDPPPTWLPDLAEVLVGPAEAGGSSGRQAGSIESLLARLSSRTGDNELVVWTRRLLTQDSEPELPP